MKRFISLLICIIILLSAVSCGKSEYVMTCGDYSIDEGEYTYYLATYKGKFKRMYKDFEESDKFYSTVVGEEGLTMGEFLFNTANESIKMTLSACAMFDEYGLTLDDYIYDLVDEYIDALIEDVTLGDRDAFDEILAEYGVDTKDLREIYLRDEKVAALLEFLYGDKGEIGITDADRSEYLAKNYVRARHIYVNNKYKYSVDENGYLVYTDEGYAQTEPLSNEELEKKNTLVSAIDESISAGGNFDEIYEGLSEDKFYSNGYYFTKNSTFIREVIDAAFSLEVGEWIKLETEYGVHYVMRLEMDESPWDDDANADFFAGFDDAIANSLFSELVKSKIGDVITNDPILYSKSIKDSPTNYKY